MVNAIRALRVSGSVCLLAACASAQSATVLAPVAGDPGDGDVSRARLVATSCKQLERGAQQEQERQIREMRQAMKRELEAWKAEQPSCWTTWGDEIGDSFGFGGLGLSGIGEGGSGRGEGIGLGSIGSIGHGAGAGQGFGSGHGRLSGSHRTRAPEVRMGAATVPGASHSMSGTNNQVADVDEADIVKSDGEYIYLVINGALRIVASEKPHLVSVTKLPGQAREMFIEGNRAAVYVARGSAAQPRCTYGYDCQFTGDGTETTLLIYDIENRSKPALKRRIDWSGSLLASRRVGAIVHTVVATGDSRTRPYYATWPENVPRCGIYESAVRAQLNRLEQKNEQLIRQAARLKLPSMTDNGVEKNLCDTAYRTASEDKGVFVSIVSLDLKQDARLARTVTIQSNPGAVFATAENIYLAVTHRPANAADHRGYSFYGSDTEATDIHRFKVGNASGMALYAGSGVVPGHVLNQFSMDEWAGNLRIATTRGRVPDPKVESSVSILSPMPSGNLVRVGVVEHLAPGEDIRSVRFEGDRGYIVTFKKTDPLFVLDLKTPDAPKVLGELKIPGFSTYMHRIDDNHLLSIGFDANDHGDFAYFDGVILQLFDVKDALHPKLLFKEKIGTRGSSSEAATNHLAFNYFAERGLLALPMTICEGGGDGRNGDQLAFGGLLVYDVSMTSGFHRLGGVNHDASGQSCSTWWSGATSAVKRSLFIDDLVFSIADDRMKVQKLQTLGKDLADIRLL